MPIIITRVALLLGLLLCPLLAQADLGLRRAAQVLYVQQTDGELCTWVTTPLNKNGHIQQGVPQAGCEPRRQDDLVLNISARSPLRPLPAHRLRGGYSADRELIFADAYFRDELPKLARQMQALMQDYQIASGWFDYRQRVTLFNTTYYLVVSMVVKASGGVTYGGARFVESLDGAVPVYSGRAYYLVVTYYPKQTQPPIDAARQNAPLAGQIEYYAGDANLRQLGGKQRINVNGAFDEKVDQFGRLQGDYDAGVKCLIDAAMHPGCGGGGTDVKRLLAQTALTRALVIYHRRLSVRPQDGGGGVERPDVSFEVLRREVKYVDEECRRIRIENDTRLTYRVSQAIDYFEVLPDGRYKLMQRDSRDLGTVTETYTWTTGDLNASELPGLRGTIIDPFIILERQTRGQVRLEPVGKYGNPAPRVAALSEPDCVPLSQQQQQQASPSPGRTP